MSTPNTDVADASADSSLKRKRSPSLAQPSSTTPPTKTVKTSTNQLSINYLARSSNDDLPLATKDDSLQRILHILSRYSNVLDRHESLASNLGARPLAPILIKRFERCFDAPPKIVTSHQKINAGGDEPVSAVTWLEVIEFARAHPTQFTLSTYSEGRRVCQFYLPSKQLRVQITEEDFLFINSGRCQELIPPLPIWEDEEKELSTCDVLEARLKELTNVADMVAARTRQLCHRLKGRRTAILDRRAEGGSGTPAKAGVHNTTTSHPSAGLPKASSRTMEDLPKSLATMRNELLRHFESLPQNQHSSSSPGQETNGIETRRKSDIHISASSPRAQETRQQATSAQQSEQQRAGTSRMSTGSSASTPAKHNFSRPLPPSQESSQPFRPLCQAHMDNLARGQRVIPPCDRCRRLKMDCVKNLTSCAGCTKKHARCHWRAVTREELIVLDKIMDGNLSGDVSVPTLKDVHDATNDTGEDEEYDEIEEDDEGDSPAALGITRPPPPQHDDSRGSARETSIERAINDRRPSLLETSSSKDDSITISVARQRNQSATAPLALKSISQQLEDLEHLDTMKTPRPSSIGGFRAMNYMTPSLPATNTLPDHHLSQNTEMSPALNRIA